MNMKNIYAFARAMAYGRRIKSYDLDDIVQTAMCDAVERGVTDEEKCRGFIMIGILRFQQTRSRIYKSPAVRPRTSSRLDYICVEDDRLTYVDTSSDIDIIKQNILSLSHSLRETMLLTLQGMDKHQIARIRGVKPQTVAVDRCRAMDILRRL